MFCQQKALVVNTLKHLLLCFKEESRTGLEIGMMRKWLNDEIVYPKMKKSYKTKLLLISCDFVCIIKNNFVHF